MMRIAAIGLMFGIASVRTAASQQVAAQPLTPGTQFQLYLRQTYSLPSVLVPAGIAGIEQLRHVPAEWPTDGHGYLARWGTQRGEMQIGYATTTLVAAAIGEDPRFAPSGRHGFGHRMGYVLEHTFLARTADGRSQPPFGVFAGAVGAGFVPSLWLPPSQNSASQSLERTAIFLGADAGANMGIEFGPDGRRFLHDHVLNHLRPHPGSTSTQPRSVID